MGITKQLTWKLTGLFSLLLLSAPFQLSADSGYGLTVSPEKCFVLESSEHCEVPIKIKWRALSKNDYCLFRQGQRKPLNCWQKSIQGVFEYLLLTDSDTQFELRISNESQSIYQAELKLFKQIKQLKKRRRNPWSFY